MSDDTTDDWIAREHARRSDPHTSLLAAASMKKAAKSIAARVLKSLKEDGPGNFSSIAARTGLSEAQVWRRCSDLEKSNLIEETGRAEPGRSGAKQRVWQAVR